MGPMEVAGLLTAFAGLAFFVYFFFGSFAYGAGYEPTSARVADRMIRLANPSATDLVIDLGAGTGELALRVARDRGSRVRAVEIDRLRAVILSLRQRWGNDRDRVTIVRGNLFDEDLTRANVVFAFLWPATMARLRPKLERELRPGARFVTHYHPIPGWVPYATSGPVYAYRAPECWASGATRGGT